MNLYVFILHTSMKSGGVGRGWAESDCCWRVLGLDLDLDLDLEPDPADVGPSELALIFRGMTGVMMSSCVRVEKLRMTIADHTFKA